MSKSRKYWAGVIERFYGKYKGVQEWHLQLAREVLATGKLSMPTGRVYEFPRADVAHREWYWLPKIKNYPVQGLGADLVAIARVSMWKRLRKAGIPCLFQSTVHDSIDLDVPNKIKLANGEEVCYNSRVVEIVRQSILDVPRNFKRLFGEKFHLPLTSEISVGPTLADQRKV